MAVIRKKGNKGVPPISTASLPDVIFMILFFFMTTTSMKETELRVAFTLPEATEIQKLEKKSLVSYIYVGQPTKQLQAQFGTAPRIQLNDTYRTPQDILDFIAADRYTRMGIITDVKQELRKANALRVTYAASKSLGYN